MAIITFWLKLLHSTKKLTKQTLLRCCKFDRRCRNGFKISLSCKPNNTRLKQYYKRSQEHSWHARSPFTDLEDKTTLQDTSIVSTVSRGNIATNSAGQLAKFRGSHGPNHPNSAARHGLLSMTENCSETSVIEVWHYTKGWHALVISRGVCIGLKLC